MYRALCILKKPVTVEILKKLNISEPFTMNQWTPLRVLHRRPLHLRPRTIYKITTYLNKRKNYNINNECLPIFIAYYIFYM